MHYPLASPIHGGGGPRKRWKGLVSGDNASYSFLHHSGGTPFGGWRHHLCPGGKHVTGFSGRCASLQHGYHRLTGFSGRCCSPTNPVRWCNSSSFATPLKRGHYGRWTLRSICAWSSSEGKTIQPGFTRGKCPPLVPAAQKGGEATGDGSFPPTGIYYRLSQMRHVLRAFCIECASQLKLALRRVVVEVTLSFLPSYTLLPLRGTSPQGETRNLEGPSF